MKGSDRFSDPDFRASGSIPEKRSDPGFSYWPSLVAIAGFALTLATFWPGYLSWDSAYQWWQARGGTLDPAHPPVMVQLWRMVRAVLPDPGGMLALQAALWWAAAALFAHVLGGSAWRRAGTTVLLGAWPPLLAVLPHLWKDVWTAALFALAVAMLAADLRTSRPAWRVGAFVAIALGCAFRFNALSAAIPLLAWIAWRQAGPVPPRPAAPPSLPADVPVPGRARALRRRRLRVVATTALLVLGVQLVSGVLNRAPDKPEPVWPLLAMWDIAAVSIAEDRVLFPPGWIDPAATVTDLRRDFVPYVNVPSFERGQLHVNPYYEHSPEDFDALRAAWLALPREHPRAYFAHRATVSGYLAGLFQPEHPDGLVLSPGIAAFRDNPPIAANTGVLNRAVQPMLSKLVDAPLFAPWPYLVLSLAIAGAALAWRHGPGHRELAGTVAASSLCLAAPLVLLAPSSDFRYLLWSVAAGVMAALLWFAPPDGET